MQCWSEVTGTTNLRKIKSINQRVLDLQENSLSHSNIELENVEVDYNEHQIYQNLSLNIPYGSKILLQGPSEQGRVPSEFNSWYG